LLAHADAAPRKAFRAQGAEQVLCAKRWASGVLRKARAGPLRAINWNIAAPPRVTQLIFKLEDAKDSSARKDGQDVTPHQGHPQPP
jgi:hypothetical protein